MILSDTFFKSDGAMGHNVCLYTLVKLQVM